MDFKKLTNVRPSKDLGTKFIVSCVPGQLKLTPDACDKLKVGAGSYVGVVKDQESGNAFIFKGSEDTMGGKLAGNATLSFSAAAAWNELDGDEDYNTSYNIADDAVSHSELEGSDYEGLDLYELSYDTKEEKAARKSRTTTTSKEDSPVATPTPESESEEASFDDL